MTKVGRGAPAYGRRRAAGVRRWRFGPPPDEGRRHAARRSAAASAAER
ncbi:hypothetical protein BURPS1655_K0548 [Burkholderia pseudomallei 1655]|nr:hypothetical protein BURPS1655_K0548 [Burkholderia pseudomallei 1655]